MKRIQCGVLLRYSYLTKVKYGLILLPWRFGRSYNVLILRVLVALIDRSVSQLGISQMVIAEGKDDNRPR